MEKTMNVYIIENGFVKSEPIGLAFSGIAFNRPTVKYNGRDVCIEETVVDASTGKVLGTLCQSGGCDHCTCNTLSCRLSKQIKSGEHVVLDCI